MRFKSRLGAISIGALTLVYSAATQERPSHGLVDARTVFREISANDPEAKIERAENALATHLRDFTDHSNEKLPLQAAQEWLALVDEAIALPHRSFFGTMGGAPPMPIGTLFNVLITLPSPESWPDIRALVEKRPPSMDRTSLQLLCARLTGDNEAVIRLCDEYAQQAQKQVKTRDGESDIESIRWAALRRLGKLNDPKTVEKALEGKNSTPDLPSGFSLFPPDIAREVMLRVLKTSGNAYLFRNRDNIKIAREVILAHLYEIPTPLWELADGWSDAPFVQKLVDQFGLSNLIDSNNQADSARRIYLRDLAIHGRLEEVVKMLSAGQDNPRIFPNEWGPVKDVDLLIARAQERLPKRDLSYLYADAAVASGHIPQAIIHLRSQAANPALSGDRRLNILSVVLDLDARIGDLKAFATDCDMAQRIRGHNAGSDPAYKLLNIAIVAGDESLLAKGIAHDLADSSTYIGPGSLIYRALRQRGKLSQVEKLDLDQLMKSGFADPSGATIAQSLCITYYMADRPSDVLAMLSKFPNWQDTDLTKFDKRIGSYFYRGEGSEDQPLSFYAAWALGKTGQIELALRILRDLLVGNCDWTPCYDLLNQIGGTNALSVYDSVIRAHPFAPQPILWKGDLLLRLGKRSSAEACLREAMAIDPTGSFAYRKKLTTLQAKLLLARGDITGAKKSQGHIEAIRLASRGEEMLQAGLYSQARQTLERAVSLWPQDSALQAELARCLDVMCLPVLSMQHYRLSFEFISSALGEDSIGTYDIQTMLTNPNLEQLGIETLTEKIAAGPRNARAFFARGMMNSSAGHSDAAVSDLKQAVSLSPHFAAAWESLAKFGRQGLMSPAEAEAVEFKLIDLDMNSMINNSSPLDLSDVTDLGRAYRVLKIKLQGLSSQTKRSLFPLHSRSPVKPLSVFPRFDPFDKLSRFPGWFFQQSYEISLIAGLYHPTSFPFE